MSQPLIGGMFEKGLRARQLTSINMGETKFVQFGPGEASCVGTEGLAGCTAVMIVSPHAVIMSHIPPSSNADLDMDIIEGLYRQHWQWFPHPSSTVVGASYNQRVLLIGPKADIITARFRQIGIQPRIHPYNPDPESAEFAGRGTVLVDGRGTTINVYIEDTLAECIAR